MGDTIEAGGVGDCSNNKDLRCVWKKILDWEPVFIRKRLCIKLKGKLYVLVETCDVVC